MIVECVPNFSEGRDLDTVNAIADAIKAVPGVSLLDVAPGASTNRTVVTFVGDEASIVEGALAGARVARQKIDMRKHKGAHARMGALDVCPFVPVSGCTVDDCVRIANTFAKRASEELGISLYLYEHASVKGDYRRSLAQIRSGEYEALAGRIVQPKWKPDYGPASFDAAWGATVTGCREFLIAYNVNILGTKEQAHRIALNLREGGRGPDQPGRLKKVKGVGWYVDEYNMAQLSVNLDDFTVTPPHVVFEEAKKDAQEIGLAVVGSELVGLIPLDAILMAAQYYEEKEGLFLVDQAQRIRLVIERLGLSSIRPFEPEKGIIELAMGKKKQPLADGSLAGFVKGLGARTPAPGGGSASAVMAAIGAALSAMMGWLSYGNRKFEHLDAQMRRLIRPLHESMEKLLPLIDEDTVAFDAFMASMRLPKSTPEESAIRDEAMNKALQNAVLVPFSVMKLIDECWPPMIEMAAVGNINSESDLAVGAKALEAGSFGAHRNVMTNLTNITDQSFVDRIHHEAEALLARAYKQSAAVVLTLDDRIKGTGPSKPKRARK